MRAYIIIETQVGKSKVALEGVRALSWDDVKILSAEAVTGPYDIVVHVDFEDVDRLATAVAEGVQRVDGVQRTTMCLVITP
jgi:DNA-binding Lrp family transcriptional regulator